MGFLLQKKKKKNLNAANVCKQISWNNQKDHHLEAIWIILSILNIKFRLVVWIYPFYDGLFILFWGVYCTLNNAFEK